MKNTRVVAIGGANIDVLGQAKTALAFGDSTLGEIHLSPGGVARNVAENLARLGLSAWLISVVGADAFGEQVLRVTAAAGVDVSAVARVAGARTGCYLSVHGPQGELAHAINDMAVLDSITPEVLASHLPLLGSAAGLVVDCNLSAESLTWLLNAPLDPPIFLDAVSAAKSLRVKPWLARVHALKLNVFEAQALLGCTACEGNAAERKQWVHNAMSQLHALGIANVVLSLGKHGAAWCDVAGQVGQSEANAVDVVNTTGAGDALLAGLVFAHMRQMPLEKAVPWALRCAEITLQSHEANAANLSVEWVDRLNAAEAVLRR